MLKVGYFQFKPQFGKIKKNTQKVIQTLKCISADLIVLPELPFTGYYFKNRTEVKELAENPYKSSTIESLISLCKSNDFYLVTGFAEKKRNKYYNSSILLGPEGIRNIYRKLHLFNEEKFWFDPGDKPSEISEICGINVGMMICFDWIFPELMRDISLQGADVICHPSNLVLSFCQQTMIGRCIENNVFAITSNRFGSDNRPHGALKFTGKSQIVAPRGILLHRALSQREELYITEIDSNIARDKKITPHNDIFTDRRPECYKNLY
jgi:predicted amidohydrolase